VAIYQVMQESARLGLQSNGVDWSRVIQGQWVCKCGIRGETAAECCGEAGKGDSAGDWGSDRK